MKTGAIQRVRAAAVVAGLCLSPALGLAAAPSALERDVLDELNYARMNPADYAEDLRDYRERFTGHIAHEVEGDIGVGTFEGPKPVDEAIRYVDRLNPGPPAAFDPALARAAADHADDQSRTGQIGHAGSDGSRPGQRIGRYSLGRSLVGEIISYGQPTAARVIRQLVVDDGDPPRPHRADLFEPAFTRVGVACRRHPRYGQVCVIDLSGEPLARR